jgi:hypothetical protein
MRPINKHVGGKFCRTEYCAYGTATAGGSGDNTEVDGPWLDRKPAARGPYHSAKLVIAFRSPLAAAATLSFAVNIQDATDGSGTGAADFGPAYAKTVVATGGSGGTTETGTIEFDFDLSDAREFIRAQVTPDLSAANTDTVTWMASWVLFGSDRGPMTKSLIAA